MNQRPASSHFLNPRDTFEHYENRSRPQSVAASHNNFQQSGYPGQLACQYRAQPHVTAFIPETNKKPIPVGIIIAVAIAVPVLIIICLFGAVWLQELGVL
ncbi:unnamed protein product [Auanema sp. JU1783]|nr:unnamed protein product [Auanema sp. JU1783]